MLNNQYSAYLFRPIPNLYQRLNLNISVHINTDLSHLHTFERRYIYFAPLFFQICIFHFISLCIYTINRLSSSPRGLLLCVYVSQQDMPLDMLYYCCSCTDKIDLFIFTILSLDSYFKVLAYAFFNINFNRSFPKRRR